MSTLLTPPSTQLVQDAHMEPVGPVELIHHPTHYNTDVPDPIVLQVEGYLYRQSYHYLSKHILFLRRMEGLPPPPGGHQGSADDNPVNFQDVSNSTFELVLSITDLSVYSEAAQNCITLEGILNVLRFSDKWDAPGVQAYCLSYLDQAVTKKELHPILAFSIGQKFSQPSWLRDALKGIQRVPISTWINDSTILSWMSPHDMIVVLRLREHTHLSRLDLVSFRPPAIHTSDCKDLQTCSFHWDLAWAFSVVPRIAHKTFRPLELYLFVRDLEVTGMGKGCDTASRDAALRSNKFHSDYHGVEKALEVL